MLEEGTEAERHRKARVLYENTVDHYSNWFKEVQEDLDFHDGHQWEEADVEFLQKQNRPVLTFNLTQGKILHLIGANSDNMQDAVIAPNGMSDRFLADILDFLKCQVYRQARVEDADEEVFENGIKAGISGCDIDVLPDPDNREAVLISVAPLHPVEVLWDPGSDRKDKSDASYLFRHRWMSVSTFKMLYPKNKDDIDEVMNQRDSDSGIGFVEKSGAGGLYDTPDLWRWAPRREMLYYDRRKEMVRVIRLQYKKPVKHLEIVAKEGLRREIPAKLKAFIRENYPDFRVEEYNTEETFWLDFTGHLVLYDGVSPLPFPGFSVVPYVCSADDKNWPYGRVRPLKDPQREVNKRYSQTLHLINSHVAPGIFAETDSVVSEDQAKASMKQAQSITWLQKGSLSQQRIKERGVPPFPESVAKLHEVSIRMFDFISGVYADDMVEPRGVPEAAATAQLHHRKSMMSTRPLLQRFWTYKREVAYKITTAIIRTFPDQQIAEYLARSEVYEVKNGIVTNRETKQSVNIRDIRSVKLNVILRPASKNETERLLELQVLMSLLQFQVPVSPDVLFDLIGLPDDKREELKLFARSMAQQQSQAAMKNLEQTEQQIKTQAMIDMIEKGVSVEKSIETRRHNIAQEYLEGLKLGMDTGSRMNELWEKANDSQRQAILKLVLEKFKGQNAEPSMIAP